MQLLSRGRFQETEGTVRRLVKVPVAPRPISPPRDKRRIADAQFSEHLLRVRFVPHPRRLPQGGGTRLRKPNTCWRGGARGLDCPRTRGIRTIVHWLDLQNPIKVPVGVPAPAGTASSGGALLPWSLGSDRLSYVTQWI